MLTRLKINNFKCFEALDIEVSPLTFLIGKNSSGKSTVIQAILLAYLNSKHENTLHLKNVVRAYSFNNFNEILNKYSVEKSISISIYEDELLSTTVIYSDNMTHSESAINRIYEKNLYYLSANRIGPEEIADISNDLKIGEDGRYAAGSFDALKDISISEKYNRYKINIKESNNKGRY